MSNSGTGLEWAPGLSIRVCLKTMSALEYRARYNN